jgi:hypothetical protein
MYMFGAQCPLTSYRYFIWNVGISSAVALMLLSWGRNALYAWNIAHPEGIAAETPVFPFTSSFARVLVALSLSLIIGLFIVLFFLSIQLGQLISLSFISLCTFVFIFILFYQCFRTFNMCKNLAFSQPWFLHSLAIGVAMLAVEVIWLCQGLLVYRLPVDRILQPFIPLGSFSDETSQVGRCFAVFAATFNCLISAFGSRLVWESLTQYPWCLVWGHLSK